MEHLKEQARKEYKRFQKNCEAELARAIKRYTKDDKDKVPDTQQVEQGTANDTNNLDMAAVAIANEPTNTDPTAYNFNNYTKSTPLGRGSIGTVFKCINNYDGHLIAVKEMIICQGSSYQKHIEAFENEIKIYKRLCPQHPCISQYFDTKCENDMMYLFMEYMDGGSIADYLSQNGPMSAVDIAKTSKQILLGLQYLHLKGIIHRDIKGSNILRNQDNIVKLCDFGLSKHLQTISIHSQSSGFSGEIHGGQMAQTVCGTPYWMAPEVINVEKYSTQADVWSLGATVIEMLSGCHPYPNVLPLRAMYLIGNTKKLEYDCPGPISDELRLFIESMLVGEPQDRSTVEMLLQSQFIVSAP